MNLQRIDLVTLSLFNQVAHAGSISGGAELAGLALGAASKRISDLELAVGCRLLQRRSRGVSLTPAGEALQRHAISILGGVDRLAAEMSDYALGTLGIVRLSANTSAVTQFLPADLAAFAAVNPGVRIALEEQDSDPTVLAVLDGRADLGIFADRTDARGLHTVAYRDDELVVVVPRGHELSRKRKARFSEVLPFDVVSLSAGTSLAKRLQVESDRLAMRLKVRITVRSFDAMCQMVAAGLGIAVLPNDAIKPHVQSMGLRRIQLDEPWSRRRLLLGVKAPDAIPKHVRLLFDFLSDRMRHPQ
ncbi:LysR substrate-binding domain-containing protein [soil metagenome]